MDFSVFPLAADVAPGALDLPVRASITSPNSYATRRKIASAGLPVQATKIAAWRPDLVHQHHGVWTAGAIAGAAMSRARLVTTFHGTDAATAALQSPRGLQRVHRANSRWAFARSDIILGVSSHLRDVLLRAGAPPEKTLVHYQGVDTGFFTPPQTPRDSSERPRIVCIAGLIPLKRVHLAIRASQRLFTQRPHELEIIGQGPLEAELRELASDSPHIAFSGGLLHDEVRERLRAADLLVLPSEREAAGLVLLEAQACGLPVVVTGGDGKTEMLEPGVTGAVVDPDPTPDALARAMADWLPDSADAREQIGRETRRFVVDERSVAAGAQRLEEIYDELLA